MQSHIIKRTETFPEKHDRRLIGWDEILEGGLPPQATVMSWQGTEGGLAAASAGHDVVMSPVGYLYLDYLQTASPNEPPAARPRSTSASCTTTSRCRPSWRPTSASTFSVCRPTCSPSTRAPTHACSTTCSRAGGSGRDRLEHAGTSRLPRFPRAPARAAAALPRLGPAYAQTPFEVGVDYTNNRAANTVTVSLANPLGYEVRYSTDGQPVTAQSPLYQQPLTAQLPATVQAAAFYQGQMLAAKPTVAAFSAQSLLSRRSDELLSCVGKKGLVLRRRTMARAKETARCSTWISSSPAGAGRRRSWTASAAWKSVPGASLLLPAGPRRAEASLRKSEARAWRDAGASRRLQRQGAGRSTAAGHARCRWLRDAACGAAEGDAGHR